MLFSITTDGKQQYVLLANSTLNSHLSMCLVKNKYLARTILARENLPNIPFLRPKSTSDIELFLQIHKNIVIKPLRGSGSKGVKIVNSTTQILDEDYRKTICERYIPGREFRFLVLNGEVIAVHESVYGNSVDPHRNLERISYEPALWDMKMLNLSLQIAKLFNLKFAGIDFMVDKNNHPYILEVNASPGIKWFHAPTRGPKVDVATQYLKAMLNI